LVDENDLEQYEINKHYVDDINAVTSKITMEFGWLVFENGSIKTCTYNNKIAYVYTI
jgi:hypothetical protein